MRRVWLVRHGATTAPPGAAIGSTAPPLSDEGLAQAGRLAAQLAGRPLQRVLSSDLKRALSTADAIAAAHRELLTLHELIAHRLVQILLSVHRGRVFSIG